MLFGWIGGLFWYQSFLRRHNGELRDKNEQLRRADARLVDRNEQLRRALDRSEDQATMLRRQLAGPRSPRLSSPFRAVTSRRTGSSWTCPGRCSVLRMPDCSPGVSSTNWSAITLKFSRATRARLNAWPLPAMVERWCPETGAERSGCGISRTVVAAAHSPHRPPQSIN